MLPPLLPLSRRQNFIKMSVTSALASVDSLRSKPSSQQSRQPCSDDYDINLRMVYKWKCTFVQIGNNLSAENNTIGFGGRNHGERMLWFIKVILTNDGRKKENGVQLEKCVNNWETSDHFLSALFVFYLSLPAVVNDQTNQPFPRVIKRSWYDPCFDMDC